MQANIGPQYIDGTDPQQIVQPRIISLYNGSGTAIARGNAVQIDIAVITFGLGIAIKVGAAVAANARLIIGGAWETIPDLSFGKVMVAGIMDFANVITGTAADTLLIGSVTTAGRLIVSSFAAGTVPVARSLNVAAGNVATVHWMNPGGF